MSRNGSGTYNLPSGNPVVTATTISSSWANTTLNDIANALTGSIAADGQTPITANLNINNNKLVNVADPTNAQDATNKTYVDTANAANLALSLLKASNLSDVANATTARTNLSAAKSGANSDITSLTGLTTALSVAQGGTGATTIAANNVVLGNGTSAVQTVAPSTNGNVLTSNGTTWTSAPLSIKGLGFGGETWQDVLGSRSSGTTYTAPNYPIMVAVSQAQTFQSHSIVIVVNGVTISNSGGGGNFYNGGQETSFIVPANATYSVTVTTAGFNTWAELR